MMSSLNVDNITGFSSVIRRTSLHGKSLTVMTSQKESSYRKFQAEAYNFLERPKSRFSIAYHAAVFTSVFACLVTSILSTVPEFMVTASSVLVYMELFMLFWFFVEYVVRMWSAGCRSRYQAWRGRLRFARRPLCVVDIILIVSTVVVLSGENDNKMFAASALRGLRFFQILRMIRVDRRAGSFKLLASVVWAHRQELFTTMYIGFLGLVFSSFLMYLVEKKHNQNINSYADALWWGVMTLCTVGYGDTVPYTWMGKIIAAGCAVIGISFFALPAGILGSGFALKVQEQQRQKHLIRRRIPAATLIQCLWRCYAADKRSTSVATWDLYRKHSAFAHDLASAGSLTEKSGFVRFGQRLSTIRRKAEKMTQAVNSGRILAQISTQEPSSTGSRSNNCDDVVASDAETFVFPETRRAQTVTASGYRNLQIEMREQESGQRMNRDSSEGLHSLEGSNSSSAPTRENTPFAGMFRRSAIVADQPPPLKSINQLTEQDKSAIRVIRKIRLFVARRKFREALRPYDVKDVIEQYSAGHLDLLSRVKSLHTRVDQILGRAVGKPGTNDFQHPSLTSRIIEIETNVKQIDRKIDMLLSSYDNTMKLIVEARGTAVDSHNSQQQQQKVSKMLFEDFQIKNQCASTSNRPSALSLSFNAASKGHISGSCDAVFLHSQVERHFPPRIKVHSPWTANKKSNAPQTHAKTYSRCRHKCMKSAQRSAVGDQNSRGAPAICRKHLLSPYSYNEGEIFLRSLSENDVVLPTKQQ